MLAPKLGFIIPICTTWKAKIGWLYVKGNSKSARGTKSSVGCGTVEANSGWRV